ncbi:MAG: lipopolysaccharide assembly protein LapB [Gammaproteobacteria bacterium]|nr:lipopolysaccharide assembly protein LapB [Gammaproteobacteria bacterium]
MNTSLFEWFLLLLPIAAASGWFMAKRDTRRKEQTSTTSLSSNYFRGLNYLLNEQPDKAIEVFIKMLEVDNDTVETHLALGNLFRRRGEVDRAIRIHQNLIARPTLKKPQRAEALFELGIDYMRAGLLDRAESLFIQLVEMKERVIDALWQLTDIYQQEKDWKKATDTLRRYEQVSGERCNILVAHFYCEQAEVELKKKDFKQATQFIKQALSQDRASVRASILQGFVELALGNYRAAIKSFKRVEQQDIAYLPEVLDAMRNSYCQINKEGDFLEYLQHVLQHYNGISVILLIADLLRSREGEQAAINFIKEQLHKRPSVRGLDRMVELNMIGASGQSLDSLSLIKDLTRQLIAGKDAYLCGSCGFSGKAMHWRCPGCKQWGTIKSAQGVIGE